MFQVKNLTVTHKKDLTILVEGLSFTLAPGDRAALIGEEGNGKSSVLKLLYNPALVEPYAEWTGEIVDKGLRKGYLAQELRPSELEAPVWEFCQAVPAFEGAGPKALDRAARQVGLPPELFWDARPMDTLSGGERVKLRLALLLLDSPDVLLLDEPSNDLDLQTLEWLEGFLLGCKVPVLYISHDETLLERTANRIIHIEQLRHKTTPRCSVVYADYPSYIANRSLQFDKQAQEAKNERRAYDKQLEKFRQIQQKVEHQQNVVSRQNPHGAALLKKTMHRVKAYEARFEKEFAEMTRMPEYEEAMFTKFGSQASIPNGKVVLDFTLDTLRVPAADDTQECPTLARDVRLFIQGAKHVCITGRNGCGKTTLMRILAKELLQRSDLRAAYMPQNYEELLPLEKTPVEFLSDGSKQSISMMRTYLGSMKFTADEMTHPMRELSGGQKAKIMLLYLDTSGCDVLLLDEPSRNFSPLSNPVIRRMLADYQGAIISVSHDRKYIAEVCDQIYELTAEGLVRTEKDLLLQ